MYMKKIINLILVASILLMSFSIIPTGYASQIEDGLNKESFLCAAGIIPNDRGKTEIITRAEFCSYIYKITGIDGDSSVYEFKDVSRLNWAYSYIMGVSTRRYMVGDSSGMFNPDKAITINEAAKVLVNVLGYSYVAENNGGYPEGYVKSAESIGLLKNISGNYMDELNFGDVINLLYNAINIKIMKYNSNEYYVSDDETLMNSCMKIFSFSGEVNSNQWEALAGDTVGENQVTVADKTYDIGNTHIDDSLGLTVKGFAKADETGGDIILYYYRTSDIIEISAEDIISTTLSQISYEKNSTTKTEIIPADVTFMYNGKIEFSFKATDLKPDTGSVTLIKNNGKITCVRVESYEVSILDYYSKSHKTMYFKNNNKALDLSDVTKTYRITKNSERTKDYSFNEYDVVCTAKSKDENFIDIVISTETIEGTISLISDDKILIDGLTYTVSDSFLGDKGTLGLSSRGKYYFDFSGKVVYAKYEGNSYTYCYFVKSMYDDAAEIVTVKYFDSEGSLQHRVLSSKAKFNGLAAKKSDLDKINNSVIKLRLNSDDEIIQITTPDDNTAGSITSYDATDFTMDMNCAAVRFLTNSDGLITDGARVWRVTKSTPILNIEVNSEGDINYEDCGKVTIGDVLISGKEYSDLSFYDVDSITFQPRFIVRVANSAEKMETDGNRSCVIESFSQIVNKNEEIVNAINYYYKGELKTSPVKDSAYNANEKFIPEEYKGCVITDLSMGDVCLFTFNKDDEILSFMPSFIQSKTADNKILSKDTSGYSQIRGYESVYGTIAAANEFQVVLQIEGAQNNYLLYNTNVYSYDKQRNSITKLSMNDIRGYMGKECYLRSDRKTADTIVIYE